MHRLPDEHPVPPLVTDLPLLATRRFGRPLRGYARVTSTNTLAATWAAEDAPSGAPEGSVVLAEFQTAGRGRLGRLWEATAGLNLMFSLVLRPRLPVERLGLITLAAGVAVAEVLAEVAAPLRPAIKWPNDILLEGQKCCGMLLEAAMQAGTAARPASVILGIGLNVNQDTFPPALAHTATSLLLATGRPVPRAPLLARLLEALETRYDSLFEDDGAAVRAAYADRMAGLHRPAALRLTGTDRFIRGTVAGISASGALLLRTDAGLQAFHAGEVTTA